MRKQGYTGILAESLKRSYKNKGRVIFMKTAAKLIGIWLVLTVMMMGGIYIWSFYVDRLDRGSNQPANALTPLSEPVKDTK